MNIIRTVIIFMIKWSLFEASKFGYQGFDRDANEIFPHLFNVSLIRESTHNYKFLRVNLKEIKNKGIGVFATRRILAYRTIMYYKLKIFETKNYTTLSNAKYCFIVLKQDTKEFDESKIADLFENSNQKPRGRKPYWGYLINEPSQDQRENVKVYLDQAKYDTEVGKILVYKIVTKSIVEAGEEITWCYGKNYMRSYDTNCNYD